MAAEFWGIEVKPGETVKCDPGDQILHLSQASLGETKKGSENTVIFLKVNDQKLVLGTLAADKCAQITYDLVFEKEFEVSHSSRNTSVYFCGYKASLDENESSDYSDSEDEEAQLDLQVNEVKEAQTKPKPLSKPQSAKGDASPAKPRPKAAEPSKTDKPKADKDDDADDDSDDDDLSSDEDMDDAGVESDEDEDDSSDEDEATPKKAGVGEKRPAATPAKTPVPEKRAKLVSPAGSQKTGGDGKKKGSEHTATPYPAKNAGKTTANSDKSKQQTPKSAGSVTCKSCSRDFNSEKALESHSKAKHAAKK